MKPLRSIALSAALAVAALAPTTAHARFGKKASESPGASSSPSSSGTGSHSAAPAKAPPTPHAPSGPPSPEGRYRSYGPTRHGYPTYYGGWYSPYYGYGYDYGWGPYAGVPPPSLVPPSPPGFPAPPQVEAQVPPRPRVTIGVDGQRPAVGGAAFAASVAIEAERWGVSCLFTAFLLPSDTVQGELDSLKMVDAHLTYALLRGARGRLRLEAGFNSVFAQDVVVLGPDGGATGVLGLIGPLGVEGSVHYAPWPHHRFDTRGGVSLAFGSLAVRAGWRFVLLDDNGVLQDGSRNIDRFCGPYLGLGLVL